MVNKFGTSHHICGFFCLQLPLEYLDDGKSSIEQDDITIDEKQNGRSSEFALPYEPDLVGERDYEVIIKECCGTRSASLRRMEQCTNSLLLSHMSCCRT